MALVKVYRTCKQKHLFIYKTVERYLLSETHSASLMFLIAVVCVSGGGGRLLYPIFFRELTQLRQNSLFWHF